MSKSILLCSDRVKLEIDDEIIAQHSILFKGMIEANVLSKNPTESGPQVLRVPIRSSIFGLIVEWCKLHADDPPSGETGRDEPINSQDQEFLKKLDMGTKLELIKAADYLNIESLTDVACKTIGGLIVDKVPAKIRAMFHIPNDYTPAEEKALKKENPWKVE